jgi:putative ABC transport system permease protein
VTSELRLILATHLAFYRRHPWLMALFLLGFSLGSALLTAIAGLNQEAETRYQHSSALLNNPVTHLVMPLMGKHSIDGNVWISIRQQTDVNAQPVLRGKLQTNAGQTLAIQGVDSLLWLSSGPTTQNHMPTDNRSSHLSLSTLFIDSQFAGRLKVKTDQQAPFVLHHGQKQPEIRFADDIGLWAMTDLAQADYLLNAQGQLSFIELTDLTKPQLIQIQQLIEGKARLVDAKQQDFDLLSEAFFFTLTALAMLGYIVAAFLSFNAIKLALTARKKLLVQMQLLGCTKTGIYVSLSLELTIVSLCAALLGSFGGYLIANALALDVNRTLVGLYQLDKALVIHWQWTNLIMGFSLNVLALLMIVLTQSRYMVEKKQPIFYAILAITVAGSIWLLFYASNQYQALLLCFCVLLMFILLVPRVLSALVKFPVTTTQPLTQWLHLDTAFHLKDLHIAIIAILVALGSAIGMQIMVKSFSTTLTAHLEKQLSADIYLRSDKLDHELRQALSHLPEVRQLSIYLQSDGNIQNIPAKLASFGKTVEHYQQISLTSGLAVNDTNFTENGCLANEQSQIKFGLSLGSLVDFQQNTTHFSCRITGFFYDYGNPGMSLLTLETRHTSARLYRENFGYSIALKESSTVAALSERLINEFKQDSTQIVPNKSFKRYAHALFEDTFVVTKALNGFILAIALLSLCTSLLSLSAGQLKQLVILRNLGVTQQQLLLMKLLQTAALVLFTALFAIPLGFALGFVLLKFVMPIAFGWTIHFSSDLTTLLLTCLTLVSISVLCAYLPIRKLTTASDRGL